jgi:hypothetical protein
MKQSTNAIREQKVEFFKVKRDGKNRKHLALNGLQLMQVLSISRQRGSVRLRNEIKTEEEAIMWKGSNFFFYKTYMKLFVFQRYVVTNFIFSIPCLVFFFFHWHYSPLWACLVEQEPSIFSYLSPTLSIIVKSFQLFPLFDFRNNKIFTVWGF